MVISHGTLDKVHICEEKCDPKIEQPRTQKPPDTSQAGVKQQSSHSQALARPQKHPGHESSRSQAAVKPQSSRNETPVKPKKHPGHESSRCQAAVRQKSDPVKPQ